MSDLTARLWKRYGDLTRADLPADVERVAGQCALDWFGCTLAGSREPLSVILRGELHDPGPASIVGTDRTAGVLAAALVNGAAGHALDFDDTHTVMNGHPTVPVLPAALALAEEQGRSGADLLCALVVGIEVECRVAAVLGPEHYAKGWHQTSTVGVFGAAAAAGWLLGLDDDAFGHAVGIAASGSAGLKANFGTMTKPLHAGHAAQWGLLAARLAAHGYTADPDAVGANQGLAQAAGGGALHPDRLDRHDDEWLTPRTLFKYHAACYLTHAGIEATSSLLDGSRVETVTLTVHPSLLDVCGIPDPTTGLEAKFSLRGTQALTLAGVDTTDIANYDDATVDRHDIRALVERVTVTTDPSLSTTEAVVVVDGGGRRREATWDAGVPATDLDAQGRRLRSKFAALAGPVLGAGRADALADALGDLSGVADVRSLRP